MKAKRKGFAIVLVAALAGLIFLLGATLVVVTRLQTASSNYDQRVRLAREHARAAMDMAVAELQDKLGKDTSVSFTADTLRTTTTDDFDEGPIAAVAHPFWTGARRGGSDFWLVTREIDGSTDTQFDSILADPVKLVGSGSVSNANLEVEVPREAIKVSGVDGYASDDVKTIGHYAYWVGDLGVKASYAIRDRSKEVSHDEYEDIVVDPDPGVSGDEWYPRQERLKQLRIEKPDLRSIVDTELATASPTNPERIDSYVNDFQFRDRFGSGSEPEYFLKGLTENNVKEYFHDFTPLSKGLLVNTASGGFRDDLSDDAGTTGSAYLDDYSQLAKDSISSASNYTDDVFPMKAKDSSGPAIHPVLTQFNLNYRIYLEKVNPEDLTSQEQYVRLAFAVSVELWNPFTSSIKAEAIRIEIAGLPRLELGFDPNPFWAKELGALSKTPRFITPSKVNGNSYWRPGEIVTFSGPESKNSEGEGPYELSWGGAYVNDPDSRVQIMDLVPTVSGFAAGVPFAFRNADGSSDPARISVKLYLKESDELLASYELEEGSDFITGSPDPIESDPLGTRDSSFNFSWEVGDDELSSFANYHPFDPSLDLAALHDFTTLTVTDKDVDPNFQKASSTLLLGANSTESDDTRDPIYDLSLLQLPKQELTSVSQLSGAYSSSWPGKRIGEPGTAMNSLFDSHYFSTVPPAFRLIEGQTDPEPSTWTLNDPLPNSTYVPTADADIDTLRSKEISPGIRMVSAENILVQGMFNVHSTSIEAWSALLKSRPVVASDPWYADFEALEGDSNTTLDTGVYLLFNYPQGAEDRFVVGLEPEDETNRKRASISQSLIAFRESEIDLLAKHIVSNIRQRVQGSGGFSSLEDFVNSRVLEDAIADADIELGRNSVFKPIWVTPNSNREFRQSTILNLIAPYLSTRSDTFLVRAYGDAVNPGGSQKVWARAYCEAIVQRTHEMHSNPNLGRRFEIVAFRWLSPSDI